MLGSEVKVSKVAVFVPFQNLQISHKPVLTVVEGNLRLNSNHLRLFEDWPVGYQYRG